MNILRIVYDWPDENTFTEGLAPAPYELSISQAKLGNKIFVLCGNLNGKNLSQGKFSYQLADGKITVYNLPRALKGFGPFLTTSIFVPFYYWYLKLTTKIDLVHNHGQLGIWLLLYKYIFGFIDTTVFIGHYHITAKGRAQALKNQNQQISELALKFEYPLHELSDYLMSKVTKHNVVVSSNIGEELIKFYNLHLEKITLLESGVDTERFSKTGEKINLDFDKGSIIIGNGGRLSKRKNIDLLVKSLVFLPEHFKLLIWGTWEESFKREVDEIIKTNNLSNRIKYLGSINYFKVDKCYRAVDIFTLPSSYEGLPKVVIEALSCGCKVLASGFEIEKEVPNLRLFSAQNLTAEGLARLILEEVNKQDNYLITKSILDQNYSWNSKAQLLEKIYHKFI
jgi:glycosyltransferase involved in cell wall biosynthesis